MKKPSWATIRQPYELPEDRPRPTVSVYYDIEVIDCTCELSFGLSCFEEREDFRDHLQITLRGRLASPSTVKGRALTFDLFGRPFLNENIRREAAVPRIGVLTLSKRESRGFANVPMDMFTPALLAFNVGLAKYLALEGAPLHRGEADLYQVRALSRLDDDVL